MYGCTTPPDSEEVKLQVAKHVLQNGRDKIFIFENFQKINGLTTNDGSYIVEVSYDLVFRKGLSELTQELNRSESPMVALGASLEIMTQLLQYGQFSAGERLPCHEKYTLVKTEQGWRLASDFNLE
jgi:hypothetical protein